jgi:hypothetical protein
MKTKILLALCLAFALASAACVKRAQVGETHVGRGELFRTGQVAFDEFFEDVNVLQRDTKTIKGDQSKALASIGKLMSLSDPSAKTVFVAVKERARKLAESKKGKAFLVLDGIDDHGRTQPGKQVTVIASAGRGQAAPKDAQELAAALDEAAKGEGQIAEKTFPMAEKAKRRTNEADRLRAQVDAEFSSKSKREEVERELDSAKRVLAEIAVKSDEAATSAAGFLHDMQQTFAALAESKGKAKGKGGAKAGGGKAGKPAGADFNP